MDQNKSEKITTTKGKDTVGQIKEKAAGMVDEQKSNVAAGLTNVADSIRQVGKNLRETDDQNNIARVTARYGETLAEKIESFSDYIEQVRIKDLTRDVEGFARRQPALFIGGAFLVGLLATRFLKTSAPNSEEGNSDNSKARKVGGSAATV